MGNLASVKNALNKLGYEASITSHMDDILAADKVILPGVGAFADSIENLRRHGLDQVIKQVAERQTPLLGICLGLQLFFTESEENGFYEGLDLIPGRVVKFELPRSYKVPHMGWNEIIPQESSRLFQGIPSRSYFYFVHSFYVVPENDAAEAARCNYGIDFTCAIEAGNIFATQFHPEKSGDIGLQVLRNFASI